MAVPRGIAYSASDPCGLTASNGFGANSNLAQAVCDNAPERSGLTTTVEHLAFLSSQTRELAERLRELIDPQYWHDSNAVLGKASQGAVPPPPPHLCENLDVVAGRIGSANYNLEGLLQFVGR